MEKKIENNLSIRYHVKYKNREEFYGISNILRGSIACLYLGVHHI